MENSGNAYTFVRFFCSHTQTGIDIQLVLSKLMLIVVKYPFCIATFGKRIENTLREFSIVIK